MPKVISRAYVNKPWLEIVHELMKEGWQPTMVKDNEIILEMDSVVRSRALRFREN